MPFEHNCRHHCRYRVTEGSEEIQIRRAAQVMFGYGGSRAIPEEHPGRGG